MKYSVIELPGAYQTMAIILSFTRNLLSRQATSVFLETHLVSRSLHFELENMIFNKECLIQTFVFAVFLKEVKNENKTSTLCISLVLTSYNIDHIK